MYKSPFYVVPNFISPLECEDIISRSHFDFPNIVDGKPIKSTTQNVLTQNRLLPYFDELIPDLEDYYGFEHAGMLPFSIEWYPQNCQQEGRRCENSWFKDGKWSRINDTDFTGIIFLKDHSTDPNFDDYFEVYGGKLEFPTHQFGFNPTRGTLIIFPSGPNFTHSTNSPQFGDLHQIRISIVPTKPYVYDMKQFPGNYTKWFSAS